MAVAAAMAVALEAPQATLEALQVVDIHHHPDQDKVMTFSLYEFITKYEQKLITPEKISFSS